MSTVGYRVFGERLLGIVADLVRFGEAPAGSHAERRLAKRIASLVEEVAGVRASLTPVPVAEWRDGGSWVEACGRRFRVLALPQSVGGVYEGRLAFFERAEAVEEADGLEGRIVVVEAPRSFDELQSTYMFAVEKGAEAVVFYDPWPGRLRRFVVTGSWDYSLHGPSVAAVPALYARREDAAALRDCSYAVVEHGGRIVWSEGYVVEAVKDAGDEEVLVTAHHDHWLTGVNDDLAGAAIALLAFASVEPRRASVRFVSFTAEEFGDPSLPAWYWAYGSRWYVRALWGSGRLDRVLAVINLDVAATRTPRVYATGFELRLLMEPLAAETGVPVKGFDHSYTDSYSFSREGVPAASIIDLEGLQPVYHSDLDGIGYLSVEGAWKSYQLVTRVLAVLAERGREAYDYGRAAQAVFSHVVSRPSTIHVREAAYRFTLAVGKALEKGCRSLVARAFRVLNRLGFGAVFDGDYRVDEGGFETRFLPQLSVLSDFAAVRRAAAECRRRRGVEARRAVEGLPAARRLVGSEALLPGGIGYSVAVKARRGADVCKALELVERALEWASQAAGAEAARALDEASELLISACLAAGEGVGVEDLSGKVGGLGPVDKASAEKN